MPGGEPSSTAPCSAACTARAAPALSRTASRTGPGSPADQPAYDVGVVGRVAAAQTLGGARRRGRARAGSTRTLRDRAVVHGPHPRGRRGGQLVEAVVAAEHPGVDARAGEARRPSAAPSARSAQPIACAAGLAGWASGPRKLKVVATPSSRRGTARAAAPGGTPAAKQNVMPTSSPIRATSAAGRSSRMPSASSTSADAGLRRRRPVAVLDHRRAGAGGDDRRHRGDVHRHRPVATGADDVEDPAARPSAGWRARTSPRRAPRAPRSVSPLARSATANPAICAGRGLAGRGSPTSPRRSAPLPRSRRATSAASTVGPGGAAGIGRSAGSRAPGDAQQPQPRSRRAAAGRSGAAPRPRPVTRWPARRPAARPVSTRIGGQRKISSFICLAMPMPPAGTASPSRIARSIRPESICCSTTGSVATSTYSTSGRSGCGRRPSARITCFAGVRRRRCRRGPAAVRRRRRWSRGDSTGTIPVARPVPPAGRGAGPRARPPASSERTHCTNSTAKNTSPTRSPDAPQDAAGEVLVGGGVGQPGQRSGRGTTSRRSGWSAHDRHARGTRGTAG